MDIRKDQHQEMFMSNHQEDFFKDDEDDDEENRLLISLDDTEVKDDDSLDGCDDIPLNYSINAQNVQRISSAKLPVTQYDVNPLSFTNAENEIQKKRIVNTSSSRHASVTSLVQPKDASMIDEWRDERSSTCTQDSQSQGPIQTCSVQGSSVSTDKKVEESGENLVITEEIELERSRVHEAKDTGENGIVLLQALQGSKSVGSHGSDLNEKSSEIAKATAESLHRSTEFIPHTDCSCIMCYQGRGVIESNWIPTAVKRKLKVPLSEKHSPKRPRNLSNEYVHRQISASNAQVNDIGKQSFVSNIPSMKHVPNDNLVAGSSPPLAKGVSQPYSFHSNAIDLLRTQNNSENYVLIVPHTCGSSEGKSAAPGIASGPSPISFSSTAQVMPSTVLPILTPKPNISPSTLPSPTVTASSGIFTPTFVTNLTSQINFTMVSSAVSSVTSTLQTPVCTVPSDKTHVVVIDKSSVDKQLAELNLNGIIQQATKVDMSLPGIVRVFYKHTSSKPSVLKVSQKSTTPLSQNNISASMHQPVPLKSNHTENAIIGLVKRHLGHLSAPSIRQKPVNTAQGLPQNSLKAAPVQRKPNILSKPKGHYSFVTRSYLPGNVNSQRNSRPLPPPPPLMPRPGSIRDGAPRPNSPQYRAVEVIDLEDEQTETMILPLPKSSLKTSSVGDTSLDISKQNEMLKSPSLFTFSSPLELSPQKDSKEPSASGQNLNCPFSISDSPLSPPARSVVVVRSSSSVSSPSYSPITTMSSSLGRKNSVHYTPSSVNSPQVVSHVHGPDLSRQEKPMNHYSNSHLQSFLSSPPSLNQGQLSNLSHASGRLEAQIRQDEGMIRTLLQGSSSTLSTSTSNSNTKSSLSSQSSVSIVNDTSGLKMKIRLKDSRPEGKVASAIEEQKNRKDVDTCLNERFMNDNSESQALPQVSLAQGCSPVPSHGTAEISSTKENNTTSIMDRTDTTSGRLETAEEMFKRFEDQAMQEVYNAQFGVGQVNRNLRPNRTSFLNTDYLFAHSKSINELKKKNAEDNKLKSHPNESSKLEAPVGMSKPTKSVPKTRRKRALSGESRHKVIGEKSIKLDINQYPKLMQDNSILNRKTIYTPNILAGHKVYVKFNTFSNPQSGRSFLVPFFNIGGSRTQFDVEDMEYVNRAVVEFEKEEKSCARHLLYHSREGKKATFLRKESGFHSLEATSKSYKKNSYILQGYTREKPKQPEKAANEWKIDSLVAIEIDRAEQDCEMELPINQCASSGENLGHVTSKVNRTDEQSSSLSPVKKLLSKMTKFAASSSLIQTSSSKMRCPDPVGGPDCFTDHNNAVQEQPIEPVSHRERVNILKKKMMRNRPTISPLSLGSQFEKSPASDVGCSYTEQLEKLIMSENVEEEVRESSSTSIGAPKAQSDSLCSESEPKSQVSHGTDDLATDIPYIKTEVVDDEYEAAQTTGKNNKVSFDADQRPDMSIKSEPVDDYTECLARSMNVSLQDKVPVTLSSPTSGPFPQDKGQMLPKSGDTQLPIPSRNIDKHSQEDGSEMSNFEIDDNILPKGTTPLPLAEGADATVSLKVNTDAAHSDVGETSDDLDEIETPLSDPHSSPVSDSSSVPSSSEVESSSDEEDEETGEDALFSISTLSCSGSVSNTGSNTASTSLPQNEGTNTPAVNNKISSLVESLKQRLIQDPPTFPLFPDIQQPKKKRKKEKKRVRRKVDPKSPKASVLARTTSDVDVPVAGGDSQPQSPNFAKPSAISSPRTICKDENAASNEALVDIKPVLLPFNSPSLPSSTTLPASSCTLTLSASTNLLNGTSLANSKRKVVSLGCDNIMKENLNVENDLAPKSISSSSSSSSSCDNVQSLTGPFPQTSTDAVKPKLNLHGETINTTHKTPLVSKLKQEVINGFDEEICLLNDVTDSTDTATQRCNDTVFSTCYAQSGSSSKDSIHNLIPIVGSTSTETFGEKDGILNQCLESNCSTPCSEIDVGMEEIDLTIENPMKHNFAPIESLLTSPPVPSSGQKATKDFTREHDLMLPFGNVPKAHSRVGSVRRNVNAKDLTSEKWSVSVTGKNNRGRTNGSGKGSFKSHPKAKENTPLTDSELKPTIASLLCEKLAIEVDVDPVADPIKRVTFKPNPVSTKTKVLRVEERPPPPPISTDTLSGSFYKPTLSAIFGVDNIPVGPSKVQQKNRVEVESPINSLQRKPRRQVAVKAVCNRKNAQKRPAANKTAVRKPPPSRLKPKCKLPPSPKNTKEKLHTASRKVSEIKTKAKAGAAIQNKKLGLQSVFRTWRQLSHEQRNKSEKVCPPQIKTVPCKVVLHRLRLDVDGKPVTSDNEDKKETSAAENNQEKEQRLTVNARKRRKKSALKTQRRRQPKDIVDFYALMLENLRKKAEMLEKEETAKKNPEKSRNKVSEPAIKIEPIVFEDESCKVTSYEDTTGSNVLNFSMVKLEHITRENSNGDAEFCSEANADIDIDNGSKRRLSQTQTKDNNNEWRENKDIAKNSIIGTHVMMEDDSKMSEKSTPHPMAHPPDSDREPSDKVKSRGSDNDCSVPSNGVDHSIPNETDKFCDDGKDNLHKINQSKKPDQNDMSHQSGDVQEKDAIANPAPNSVGSENGGGNTPAKDKLDPPPACLSDRVSGQHGNVQSDEDRDISVASVLPQHSDDSYQVGCAPGSAHSSVTSESPMESKRASSTIGKDNIEHSSPTSDSGGLDRKACGSADVLDRSCPQASKQIAHPAVDRSNSFLSDSSEPGGLVIDYESEEDTAKDTEKSSLGVENDRKNSMCLDASDTILSDSSFRTKDIVLGFENELGADTVFSTLSQGDMEDLFLLEDGEEDSQIGMIPEEEVERLLGLDVTNEAENESLRGKQARGECSQSSSATSLPATLSKLCWIPLPNGKCEDSKNKAGDELESNSQGRHESVKPSRDSSPDRPRSEHHLPAQQKNLKVSPSWNRLLGSEALRQMEKSVPSTAQFSGGQQNKALPSTGQLKVKFAGALSRALKLSAEMKKVFSEGGSSQETSKGKSCESDQSACAQSESGLKMVSGVVPKTKERKSSQQQIHPVFGDTKSQTTHTHSNTCTTFSAFTDSTHEGMPMQRKTRSRSKASHGQDGSLKAPAYKPADLPGALGLAPHEAPKDNSTSADKSNSNGILSSHAGVALGRVSVSFSNTSQTSTAVPTLEINSKLVQPKTTAKLLTQSAKGIDLNKLKLKLNPLLSSSKSQSANLPKGKDSNTSASDPNIDSQAVLTLMKPRTTSRPRATGSSGDSNSGSEHQEQDSVCSSTKQNKELTIARLSETENYVSEPVINTAKLCNILKKLKKPVCSLKQSKTDGLNPAPCQPPVDSSTDSDLDHPVSTKAKASNSRQRLRSSPRLGQNQKGEQDFDKADSAEVAQTRKQGVGEGKNQNVLNLKKAEDDDKGERSFIDCLSDVISGAWEKS